MIDRGLVPKISLALACLTIAGCAARDIESEVPDFVLQHTLSSLLSGESFTWEETSGEVFVIRPLGTFRNDDRYCRDYEISLENVRGTPVKRTACRVGERWQHVERSELEP